MGVKQIWLSRALENMWSGVISHNFPTYARQLYEIRIQARPFEQSFTIAANYGQLVYI